MRYGKSSFIVTVHVILIRVHFSALIIDTLATFGPATPTKHGCKEQHENISAIHPAIAENTEKILVKRAPPYLDT